MILVFMLLATSANAITANEARVLSAKKPTPKWDQEIRRAAKDGQTAVEFSVQCVELRTLELRGFRLDDHGCAPPELSGRCSCVVKW